VVGLLVAAAAVLVRRTPAMLALGAFLAAALAGWTGLLPIVDVLASESGTTDRSLWLFQAAGVAALAASAGFVVAWGGLAERMPTTSTRLSQVGVVVGGILVIASPFLAYYEVDGKQWNVWELSTGIYDVLAVLLGAAVVGAGIAAALSRGHLLPWVAALTGCVTFFFVFAPSDLDEDYSLEIGWWLALGGAAAALVCGLIGWLAARPARL
jgi:hypothetical protein